VWELKRFVLLSNPEPMGAVNTDYGFMHCQSAQECISLHSVYTKFFSVCLDEMELANFHSQQSFCRMHIPSNDATIWVWWQKRLCGAQSRTSS